jgi:hypothetical protein
MRLTTRAVHREFSDSTLTELLRALHARTTEHPQNPGLIASWPGVPEDRMAAACAELRRRGHPVFRVYIEGANPGVKRETWAVAANADEPMSAR